MDSFEIGMLKSEVKTLTGEVDRLTKRVQELEVRWEMEILGGLNGEVAELRGTVSAMQDIQKGLTAQLLKLLRP